MKYPFKMFKAGARIALLAFVFSISISASGAQISCKDIFAQPAKTPAEILLRLDDTLRGQLLRGLTLSSIKAEMGLLRRWKLASLERRLDLPRMATADNSDVIRDLHLIFIEPRMTSLDIFRFLRNDDSDLRLKRWVETSLLDYGIKSLLKDPGIQTLAYSSTWQRTMKLFATHINQFKSLPFILPFGVGANLSELHKTQQIPSELLLRVLTDGLQAHQKELSALYGPQKKVDLYRALRPYVSFLGFLMLSTVSNYGVDSYIHYKALQGGTELVQQTEATEKGFAELITSLREQQQKSAKSQLHN